MTDTKAVALTEDQFLQDANSGLENVGADDLALPFLKIAQAMSPQLKKHDGQHIEGLEEGDLFNSLDGTVYKQDKGITVVPVAYKRTWLEWRPDRDGLEAVHNTSEILAKTTKGPRGEDVLANGNTVQATANHYVFILDEKGDGYKPALLPLTGSQLKKSRKWNAMMAGIKIRSSKGQLFTPATFSHKYHMKTGLETWQQNSWFGVDFSLIGRLGGEEAQLYEEARSFAKSIVAGEVEIPATTGDEAIPF
tara:strand:+ start:6741 stop:7490 length:750 start_codon:yes stop_codon:yes gene_type:complete